MKRIFISALFLFLFLFLFNAANAQNYSKEFVDGSIYVRLSENYPLDKIIINDDAMVDWATLPFISESMVEIYDIQSINRPFHLFANPELLRTFEIRFGNESEIDAFINQLSGNSFVEYAEKVPLMHVLSKVNDPYYSIISGHNFKWYLEMIRADSAWGMQTADPNVKVAVVDGFVWGEHPDLQIDSQNLCMVAYNGVSGYKYNVGYAIPSTVIQSSSLKAYEASHGTHCAGLAGAINNNNTGIASIGGGVTLMGVGTTTDKYPEYVLYGMQGVQWAAEHGANVISMSFGGYSSSQTQQSLMETCYDAGIVLVASAGNDGNVNNKIIYPAGYSCVISVASVDGDGKLSYFSQWGSGRADIAAPGGFIKNTTYPNVLSTTFCKSYILKQAGFSIFEDTYYDGMQGTSMACPIVAGLCGLLLSKDSTLSPDVIKDRLQKTAIPLNAASEHTIDGYGYIDAFAALKGDYITVSNSSMLFSNKAGFKNTLTLNSTKSWTLSNLPSWLTVDKMKGDSGITVLTFMTIYDNTDTVPKISSFKITGSGEIGTKTISVKQVNHDIILKISSKNIVFEGAKSLRDTIIVYSTVDWKYTCDATWLAVNRVDLTSDSASVSFVTRSTNSWDENRTTYFIISVEGLENDTVFVTQKKSDFINVSTIAPCIGAYSGDSVSINVYSNTNWTLSGGDSWLQPNITEGRDSMEIIFKALSTNQTEGVRTATYYVLGGNLKVSLAIKQSSALSILEVANNKGITLYPNPTSSTIECKSNGVNVTKLKLYNIQGQLLQSKMAGKLPITFDLSEYPSGLYILKSENQAIKIIKR